MESEAPVWFKNWVITEFRPTMNRLLGYAYNYDQQTTYTKCLKRKRKTILEHQPVKKIKLNH